MVEVIGLRVRILCVQTEYEKILQYLFLSHFGAGLAYPNPLPYSLTRWPWLTMVSSASIELTLDYNANRPLENP